MWCEMQFCKVKLGSDIESVDLLLDPQEYLQFISDTKKWIFLNKCGFTTYNSYLYININHDFNDSYNINLSKKIKHLLREDKLNKLI